LNIFFVGFKILKINKASCRLALHLCKKFIFFVDDEFLSTPGCFYSAQRAGRVALQLRDLSAAPPPDHLEQQLFGRCARKKMRARPLNHQDGGR